MSKYAYTDASEETILVDMGGGKYMVIEPDHDLWADAIAAGPDPYRPTPEIDNAEERAAMRCSPAQMRLALHRAGLLDRVQAIADSDKEASIVWEYATVILRSSPFISAMADQSGMSDDQIDDLFLAAMNY
jgi:hypothetical protein